MNCNTALGDQSTEVKRPHVRRTLSLLADEARVRVFDGAAEIAHDARSYDAGAQIEDAAHVEALV